MSIQCNTQPTATPRRTLLLRSGQRDGMKRTRLDAKTSALRCGATYPRRDYRIQSKTLFPANKLKLNYYRRQINTNTSILDIKCYY